MNVDNLHLLTRVNEMIRSRTMNKLVQTNPDHCSCNTKCLGQLGEYPDLQKKVCKSYEIKTGLVICGDCRTAPSVKNSTNKCRRTYCSNDPSVMSCSVDANTAFYHVDLCPVNVKLSEDAVLVTHCPHRFYSTNANLLVDGAYGKSVSSSRAKTNFYGMCYGGRRKCKKMIYKYHHIPYVGKDQCGRPLLVGLVILVHV